MGIIIGSARCDEYGNINGRKGDQTGREVAQEPYYNHPKGWRALRCIDPNKALMMSYCMASMCNNPRFGYSQPDRYSGLYEAKKVGYDTAKVDIPCNIDCTSGMRICLAYAGYEVDDFYTVTEYDTIMATGAFEDVTDQIDFTTGEGLCTGDILVTKGKGHTALVTEGRERTAPAPQIVPCPVGENEQAVYRMYNPSTGEHLLTAAIEEANALLTLGWQSEGVAFIAPRESDVAVFRVCGGMHSLVTSVGELHILVENGWRFEGIAFHAGGDVPVYRMYNPNSGDHVFTASEAERDDLELHGWSPEGVAFYAVRKA